MQRALFWSVAFSLALPAVTHAQTSVEVDVVIVEVEVQTVEVQTVEAPPVVVATEAPATESSIAPILRTRGEILMIGGDYDFAAWGGSAMIGAHIDDGISGGLVVGYLTELGSGPAEVNLGLEVEKDFSPLSNIGFVLLARLGTVFMLDDGAREHEGIRLQGQLGIGMRVDFDPQIALTLDLRGVLRYRPDANLDAGLTRAETVSGGAAITMGLLFRL